MSDESRSERLQLPLGWDAEDLGWLAPSHWLASAFPPFHSRRRALVDAVSAMLRAQDSALAQPAEALLTDVWSVPAAATAMAMDAFHCRIHELPTTDSDGARTLHFVVAVLACLASTNAEHPILAAADCCGWSTIPPALGAIAADLAIFLPYWHDASMHDRLLPDAPWTTDEPPASDIDAETEDVFERDLENYLYQERHAHPAAAFRREAGRDGAPPRDDLQRRIVRGLSRLAAVYTDVIEAPRSSHWSPTAVLGDWVARREGSRFASLGTVTRRHDYFLRVMERIGHSQPSTLPLYHAYADACDRSHCEHVERAALALAAALDARTEGNTLLRCATRRFFAREMVECKTLAQRSFAAVAESDARAAAWFAAGLVARMAAPGEPLEARAWLTTARALAGGEHVAAHLGLALDLAAVCDAIGDELGQKRAMAEVEQIRSRFAEDDVASVVDACSRPIDGDVPTRLGAASLDEIADLLGNGRVADAYAQYSEEIGQLVETTPTAEVLDRLRLLLERARAWIGPTGPTERPATTIAAWTCAAIADLHDAAGDDDGWEAMKLQQFELEDAFGASSEPERESEADRHNLEMLRGLPPSMRMSITATMNIERCLAEAERALAGGHARRARFWTARAQVFRAVLGG